MLTRREIMKEVALFLSIFNRFTELWIKNSNFGVLNFWHQWRRYKHTREAPCAQRIRRDLVSLSSDPSIIRTKRIQRIAFFPPVRDPILEDNIREIKSYIYTYITRRYPVEVYHAFSNGIGTPVSSPQQPVFPKRGLPKSRQHKIALHQMQDKRMHRLCAMVQITPGFTCVRDNHR